MTVTDTRPMSFRAVLGTTLGVFAFMAATGEAMAQSVTAGESDEVVVTATRREQAVTDIPLAVSAFSGAALENQGVAAFQDLTKIDPTFAAQNFGASFNQYIIRGVSSEIGSTVGIYLDEAPVVGGTLTESGGDGKPGLRLHDVQRVEILRGPQGTLFGSSSMSGTVRVITRRPEYDAISGNWAVSTQGINDGNQLTMGNAAINVPLVDGRLAVRAVAWGEDGGGFIDQRAPGFSYDNVNDVSTEGGRISIGARVTDRFDVLAMYVHQEIDVDGAQSWYLDQGPYVNTAQTTEPYGDQYDLYYLEGTYDLGFGTLLGAFSQTRQWVNRPSDTSPTANFFGIPGGSSFIQNQLYDAWTAEVRFTSAFQGPFQFVVGGYYDDSTVSIDSTVVRAPDPTTGVTPCYSYPSCTDAGFTPQIVFSTLDNRDVEQYAIYAQGDYELTDTLTATLGVRYYSADITDYGLIQQDVFAQDPICSTFYVYRGFGPPNLCGYVFGDVTVPYDRGTTPSSENKTSYNISLLWEPTPDTSIYGRAASGFRIGGVNNISLLAASGGVTIPTTFGPDSLWSYELGLKHFFWDRRGYLDLAVYRIDWSDQQLNSTDPSGAFDFQVNAGKTEINGVELQVSLEPVDGLTLGGGVVYTDATLAEDLPATSTAIGFDGDTIPGVAQWAGSVNGEYEWAMSSTVNGFVQAIGSYRDSSSTAFNPADPNYLERESYTVWDAAVGLRKDNWEARIFLNNVTDEAAQLAINVGNDGLRVYSPRPRSIGVRLSGTF